MLQPRTPASHLAHFESNASFEETLFRLEHALARSPWRVLARVDSCHLGDVHEGAARLFVLAPPTPEPTAGPPELTWSLTLHNEVVVLAGADNRVLVGYPAFLEATAGRHPAHDVASATPAEAWAAAVTAALRSVAAAAAGAPLEMVHSPAAPSHPSSAAAPPAVEHPQAAE